MSAANCETCAEFAQAIRTAAERHAPATIRQILEENAAQHQATHETRKAA